MTPETPTAGAETGPGARNGSQTCNYPSSGPEPSGGRLRVREDEDGLDDLFCINPATVHLERMDQCSWWLGITFDDGTVVHVNVGAVRQSQVRAFSTHWVEEGQ